MGKTGQQLDRGRFSGAIGPNQSEDLARRDVEVEALDGNKVIEGTTQAGGANG